MTMGTATAAPRDTPPVVSMGAIALSLLAGAVLGIGTNALMAAHFGQGMATDAFFMALALLHLVSKMFSVGPLRQVVMPLFVSAQVAGEEERAQRYASSLITVTAIAAGLASGLLWVAAPWAVRLMAGGFSEPAQALTLSLARVFTPLVACTLLIGLLTTFAHAFSRFALPEWLARLPSVALLAALATGGARWGVSGLAWALLAGSALQLVLLWGAVSRAGLRYRATMDWRQPDLTATRRRLAPFPATSLVTQAQFGVHRWIASLQPSGTLSAFSYADRIVQFLEALLNVAVTVLFPKLVREGLHADRQRLRQRLQRVLLLVSLVSFPFIVLLVTFSDAGTRLLFERGQFDEAATRQTAVALRWLGMSLFGFGLWALAKAVAFAVQRPGIVNGVVAAGASASIGASVTLGRWNGLTGLSIAWALIPFLMSAGYLVALRREVPGLHRVVWNAEFGRVAAATLGMALGCWALRGVLGTALIGAQLDWFRQAAGLALMGAIGLAAYWGLLAVLGVEARRDVFPLVQQAWGRRRPGRPAAAAAGLALTEG